LTSSSKEKESTSTGKADGSLSDEEASNITKQRVALAKQYIENHYREQKKILQERKERYVT